jgi:hypothetical protein
MFSVWWLNWNYQQSKSLPIFLTTETEDAGNDGFKQFVLKNGS